MAPDWTAGDNRLRILTLTPVPLSACSWIVRCIGPADGEDVEHA